MEVSEQGSGLFSNYWRLRELKEMDSQKYYEKHLDSAVALLAEKQGVPAEQHLDGLIAKQREAIETFRKVSPVIYHINVLVDYSRRVQHLNNLIDAMGQQKKVMGGMALLLTRRYDSVRELEAFRKRSPQQNYENAMGELMGGLGRLESADPSRHYENTLLRLQAGVEQIRSIPHEHYYMGESKRLSDRLEDYCGQVAGTLVKPLIMKYMVEVGNKAIDDSANGGESVADDFFHLLFPDGLDAPVSVEARVANIMSTHLFVFDGVAKHNSIEQVEEDYGFLFFIVDAPDEEAAISSYDDVNKQVGYLTLPLEWVSENTTMS